MFFSKACQYATIDEFFCKNLKFVQSNLQKYITWLKKSKKDKQEWNKACSNSKLPLRKLNILMKISKLSNLL
jgi:hypothetical protein